MLKKCCLFLQLSKKKKHMGLNEKNFRPKREKNMSIFTVLG